LLANGHGWHKPILTKKEIDKMSKRTSANDHNPKSHNDKSRAVGTARREADVHVQLENLVRRLYFGAKCGNAAAEHNLANVGVIEMVQGHVAGQMREGDNYWEDSRWEITELGGRIKLTDLKRIILRDPPLAIAIRDAEDEARDVAVRGEDPAFFGYVTTHKRILAHLNERVERIRAAQNLDAQ
jgi:hypothetical protein